MSEPMSMKRSLSVVLRANQTKNMQEFIYVYQPFLSVSLINLVSYYYEEREGWGYGGSDGCWWWE